MSVNHAPLRIFVGWDSREQVAYHVLAHSIIARSSLPVSITPLNQSVLRASGIYTRGRDERASTEFSITRFLVPYLSNYEGVSVFMDCDMLVQHDIVELLAYALAHQSVSVLACQHDYTPKAGTKFLGQSQEAYPKKNWSSLMVFQNANCRALTPELVNGAEPKHLHRFEWAKDVAALPLEWNWLVGEYAANPHARNYHWTLGGPWFEAHEDVDHADLWFNERDEMLAPSLLSVEVPA